MTREHLRLTRFGMISAIIGKQSAKENGLHEESEIFAMRIKEMRKELIEEGVNPEEAIQEIIYQLQNYLDEQPK